MGAPSLYKIWSKTKILYQKEIFCFLESLLKNFSMNRSAIDPFWPMAEILIFAVDSGLYRLTYSDIHIKAGSPSAPFSGRNGPYKPCRRSFCVNSRYKNRCNLPNAGSSFSYSHWYNGEKRRQLCQSGF